MKTRFLSLFRTSPSTGDLAFIGTRDGDELLDGTLLVGEREVGQVIDGVARFCEEGWSAEGLDGLFKLDGLWERNWRKGIDLAAQPGPAQAACDELAALDGVILELALGPGGGYLPAVLCRNPVARVIANDHSSAILRRWRKFLAQNHLGENVCFAAFDARRPVLRDASVAAVSGVGVFGSIGGAEIFLEAYRVLQPGRPLHTCDHVVDPDDWHRLPEEFRSRWEGHIPGMTKGTPGLLEQAGFAIESRELAGRRALDPDEGGLPKEASQHGVVLHVVNEWIKARKPLPVPS